MGMITVNQRRNDPSLSDVDGALVIRINWI